jgi:hypothetical protein
MPTEKIHFLFSLLIVFQFKHFFADFPLQRQYMLNKFRPGWDFILPLTIHCGVHALLTTVIAVLINPSLWWLAFVDFAIHFTMDRLKSGPRYLGRYNDPTRSSYWMALGFDQMIHHLTDYLIIYLIFINTVGM